MTNLIKFFTTILCFLLFVSYTLKTHENTFFIDDIALLTDNYSPLLITKKDSFNKEYFIKNKGVTCDLNEISACHEVFGLNRFLDTYSRRCLKSFPKTTVKKTFQNYVRLYVKGNYRINEDENINMIGIKQKLSSTIGEYVNVFKSFDASTSLLLNENLPELYYPIRIRPIFNIACEPGVYNCEYVVTMYIAHESEALSNYIWNNGLTDGIVKN